jgi:hypothetical protein
MCDVQAAYVAGCAGQGLFPRDLRWNTLYDDDPSPPWYFRVTRLTRGAAAVKPHP